MIVRDVKPFHIPGKGNIFVRDEYKNNVEVPGVEACLYLYDLNIQTLWFNCNNENPLVNLQFSFDSLSEENKQIVLSLKNKGVMEIDNDKQACIIEFPASIDDDVVQISDHLLEIVKHFQYQDVLYGFTDIDNWCYQIMHLNYEEFVNTYGFDLFIDSIDETNSYYDEDNKLVWSNEELYQKHMKYLNDVKVRGSK